MKKDQYDEELLMIDEKWQPAISVENARELKPIQKQFMESYANTADGVSTRDWLYDELAKNLPGHSAEELSRISDEIVSTLELQEQKKASLREATHQGRSKESWFADEAVAAASQMSTQEASKYLQSLDDALAEANQSLFDTLHTQGGLISQNPNLDGYIAEQYHVQTFNLNAKATGSEYRAKVLGPGDSGYRKNSVDIEIVDKNGTVVKRYQCKYCKDADATARAFEKGDYRGQQKLVPEEQAEGIAKKTNTVIKAPDGTTSKPLSKKGAKELQKDAQSGKWNDLDWNEYKVKDLAVGIGKQAGHAALIGAAVGAMADVTQKVWNGEEIDGAEVVEKALTSGADFGVKAAAAGALKVGVEKGIIQCIPKGTPAGTIANIAHVAVEDAKIFCKVATGELTLQEGFDQMEQTTVAATAGIMAGAKGASIGASIGTVFGPVGTAVGGIVGGAVGYMAGSKVGAAVVQGVQKVRERAKAVLHDIGLTTGSVISTISKGISNFCDRMILPIW